MRGKVCLSAVAACAIGVSAASANPVDIGSRRELFVDYFIIGSTTNAALVLQPPKDEGVVLRFDRPWEGSESAAYATVLQDGPLYRLYYRGLPTDDEADQAYCYA